VKKLAIVLLIVSVVGTVYAAGEAVGTSNGAGDNETVVDLVDKAVEMFPPKGKEYTMKLLNASAGPLRKGAVYVFAVDFKGRMLTHPVQQELRGQDSWEMKDAKGKLFVQDFVKIAQEQGQGWSEYWWLRVNEPAPTLKKTYIKRVPGEDILVGAGYYVK
jgi:signal transduction histidine kinase